MNKKKLNLPITENPLVIRTDFSNDEKWQALQKEINTPNEDEFMANVEFLDDKTFENVDLNMIISNVSEDYPHFFIFLADKETFSSEENHLLCFDIDAKGKVFFRVIPQEMWSVENNMSLGNMDFEEFLEACDAKKIFRGFN